MTTVSQRLFSMISFALFIVVVNVFTMSTAVVADELPYETVVHQQTWAKARRAGVSRGRAKNARHAVTEEASPVTHYMTILRTDGGESFACSGVLIAADWVLAAAHCFCNETASLCRLGSRSYIALFGTDNQGTAESTTVKQIRIHPNYNGNPSDGFDFAAIKLDENVPDINPGVRAIPILMVNDLYCHDTVVEAYSWSDDGFELLRFVGNTSADEVGQRGVQVWNSAMNKTQYNWPNNCEHSNCEPSIVVAHGMGDEYCALNDGAPLLLTVEGTIGLVGLYSWSLKNGTQCVGKLPDGGQAPSYFSQASAAIPFLQAVGARIRQPIGSVCGDGRKGLSEQCDDGNTRDGDGCSSTCQSEKGYLCATYHKTNDEVCWKSACSKEDGGSGSKSGIITGAIIGGIVGAVACAIIPFVVLRRRRNAKKTAARGVPMTPGVGVAGGSVAGTARNRSVQRPADLEGPSMAKTPGAISAPPPTPANGIIGNARTPTSTLATRSAQGGTTLAPAALTGVAPSYQTSEVGSPTTAPRSNQRGDAPNRTG